MRVPEVLESLTDQGIIDEVVRPLKSGKEAQVYLVYAGGEPCVAKVYKDALQRSFKQRSTYTEGRRVRSSRDQRAIDRGSRHGKSQQEQAWKSAEVDVIFRLHAQGVRVPTPYNFIDGVLLMELVQDGEGYPAPRLSELAFEPEAAQETFDRLMREVVRMLCAGIVHGDLSEYNVLLDPGGPVVIDFPQSVDASRNRNAKKLLVRDVDNLSAFLQRYVPGARRRPYGQEIWAAYENNRLTPDLVLTGQVRRSTKRTDVASILDEIAFAKDDAMRQRKRGAEDVNELTDASSHDDSAEEARPRRRREVIMTPAGKARDAAPSRGGRGSRGRGRPGSGGGGAPTRAPAEQRGGGGAQVAEGAPKKRRRRRRGSGGAAPGAPGSQGAPRSDAASQRAPHTRDDTKRRSAGTNGGPARPAAEQGLGSDGAPKRRRRRRRKPKTTDAPE